MLWTRDIEKMLSKHPVTREAFGGVYPCDKLPFHLPQDKTLFVANTDPAHREGEHWVLFFFNHEEKHCIYFDSYGLVPLVDNFLKFIYKHAETYTHNTRRLQDPNSDVCGYYVVYFAVQLCKGRKLESIVSYFDLDKKFNDAMMVDFVQRTYNIDYRDKQSNKYNVSFNHTHHWNQCSCSFMKAWRDECINYTKHFIHHK